MVQRVPIPATVNGVPTASPLRSLLDAAGRVGGRRLRVAIDDARRKDLIQLEALLARAAHLERHAGATTIRRMFSGGLLAAITSFTGSTPRAPASDAVGNP